MTGDETHAHHAEQEVVVDPELGVVHIVDTLVLGEREKLDGFMERHNISCPDPGEPNPNPGQSAT